MFICQTSALQFLKCAVFSIIYNLYSTAQPLIMKRFRSWPEVKVQGQLAARPAQGSRRTIKYLTAKSSAVKKRLLPYDSNKRDCYPAFSLTPRDHGRCARPRWKWCSWLSPNSSTNHDTFSASYSPARTVITLWRLENPFSFTGRYCQLSFSSYSNMQNVTARKKVKFAKTVLKHSL